MGLLYRVGAAEGERAIAQAIVYLAVAPKSNAVYRAFNQAKQHVKETPDYEVPAHLRNAPTHLMKTLGYGEDTVMRMMKNMLMLRAKIIFQKR